MKECILTFSGIRNVLLGVFCFFTLTASELGQLSGYVSPSFISTKTNITAYVGSTASLPCSVVNLGTKKVVWKRINQKHPLTIGDFVFTNDARYYIDHPDKSYQWNLVIKDVSKEHDGVYDCQISTKEEMYRKIRFNVVDLLPLEKNKVIQISGPNFTEKGEPILITCNASGNSIAPDFMDWFQNGRKLKTSLEAGISITEFRHRETRTLYSTLEIKKSKMSDAGTYICRNSRQDVVSHYVIILNADSSHEKRGFQVDVESSSSILWTSRNMAANLNTYIFFLISNCIILLLFLSAYNR